MGIWTQLQPLQIPGSNDRCIEIIDVSIKASPTADRYYSPKTSVTDAADDTIQTKHLSIPHNTKTLDTNFTVYDDS